MRNFYLLSVLFFTQSLMAPTPDVLELAPTNSEYEEANPPKLTKLESIKMTVKKLKKIEIEDRIGTLAENPEDTDGSDTE
ncbi:MAG: hypothetical protein ACK4V2_00440 [Pseudomonadota bacterium]|jgi:hypothetical protein|nr:hypothetical protein [Alphaproteobacteria bacterium]